MTRRDLAAALLSPQVLAALQHAHESVQQPASARLTWLDRASATDIEHLAAQIVPSGDTPGAREAGVVYFIDRALATFGREHRQLYRDGLATLRAKQKELFPASRSIAAIDDAAATRLLQAVESTPFFEILRTHTLMGYLGHPSHGGNRNRAGWSSIGFEDRHVFQPPFGYYDDPRNGEPA